MDIKKTILTRTSIIYLLLVVIGVVIIGQIIHLQYFTDYKGLSDDYAYVQEEVEANRGSILARDGRLLATSVPYYQIRVDCVAPQDTIFEKNVDGLSKALSNFFGDKSATQYKQELTNAREAGNMYKALGNRDVDFKELTLIKQFPMFRLGANRGGIITLQKNKRQNPYGKLAYRTIGFINDKGVGVGIENSYDFYLKGRPGLQKFQRTSGGERVPIGNAPLIRPEDGFDIQTTLDVDIQEAAESALRTQLAKSSVFEGATAVVMEVETGAIRAISNMSTRESKDGTYDETYNYAIGEATEPGSTFKLATLIALLEGDNVNLNTMIDAGNGRWQYANTTFRDVTSVGYGNISVLQAFAKSSNVAFAQLAVKHFGKKEKEFVDRLYNMKLREKYNIEILGEGSAVIRYPTDRLWSKLSLPMMSIGYEVQLTPMHTLTFYNAIANGGKMMKPYFIENLQRHDKIEKRFLPQVLSGAICSKNTVDSVQKALRYVVKEGTAKSIDDTRYAIAGKTGTAQIAFDGKYKDAEGYRKHQASFVGFFPADNPRYTMIVVLYTTKTRDNFYGGTWAAPVFKQIADKIYSFSNDWNAPLTRDKTAELALPFKRDRQLPPLTSDGVTIPDVTGMGLKDALYILERSGLQVKASGMGEVVTQHPQAGTPLDGVNQVTIHLQKVQKKAQIAKN
ncbi:MAG: transpeptidase family protein [Prevotellaceae bacterium]|jgi:cell division protein FtsI (penicillin-binding protein 3)|nr:transpeptidase family protein [Prevotellaceae bacterium]